MRLCENKMCTSLLTLSLLLASVFYCRATPLECRAERFAGSPCWLTQTPSDAAADSMSENTVAIQPDCSVPHLQFTWTSTRPPAHSYQCFQPLYLCTSSSTNITSEVRLGVHPDRDFYEKSIVDTTMTLPVGSECTFGGCYLEYNPSLPVGEWYQLYWIEPVTCTINDNGCVKNPNACDINADCSDTIGSFECTCQSGYTGNGTYCLDVDECSAGLHNCSGICSNTEGGFICQCQAGFTGDGFNCTDVNECSALDNLCGLDPLVACVNTEGSFDCVCPESYRWNGLYCEFVTKCTTDACGPNSDCLETDDGLQCVCHQGYHRVSGHENCSNIDECLEGLHGCHQNAECIDTEGGYTCSCSCWTGIVGEDSSCDLGVMLIVGLVVALTALTICSTCCVFFAVKATSSRSQREQCSAAGSLLSVHKDSLSELKEGLPVLPV